MSKLMDFDDISVLPVGAGVENPQVVETSNPDTYLEDAKTDWNLERVTLNHIKRALVHFKGNKTKTAKALGITVKTIYNKLG